MLSYCEISDVFNQGKLTVCLEKIKELQLHENLTLYDSTKLQNNKLLCEALISLYTPENEMHVDFVNHFENILALDSVDQISLDLFLLAKFNYFWWILITDQYSNECRTMVLCNMWSIVEKTYKRVTGVDPRLENSKVKTFGTCQNLLKILDHLINTQSTSLGIFLEIVTAIVFLTTLNDAVEEEISVIRDTLIAIIKQRHILVAISKTKYLTDTSYFKFGLKRYNSNISEIDIEDTLDILQIILQWCDYEREWPVLESRPRYHLWVYCRTCGLIKNKNYSLGLLLQGLSKSDDVHLADRYRILLARAFYNLNDYENSLKHLNDVTHENSALYYFLGLIHGRMGMYNLMVENFEKLMKISSQPKNEKQIKKSVEDIILALLHPQNEINKAEAMYLLAIAYSLHERFEDASIIFDKLVTPKYISALTLLKSETNRLLKFPTITTVLHDAAVMKLLLGDIDKAEIYCLQSIQMYSNCPTEEPISCGIKDIQWLQKILEPDVKSQSNEELIFYEEDIRDFTSDIIGLLIHAEIKYIQGSTDEYRSILTECLLYLSKFISQHSNSPLKEKKLILVKGLTSRTCLKIARLNADSKPFGDVDRMFKRALFCNNGDRDVFYHYATYLIKQGKQHEAEKLWRTFATSDCIIDINQCQSVSLRFILRTQIAKIQLNELKISLKL